MSVENPRGETPSLRETLSPAVRRIVASDNVMELRGNKRDAEDGTTKYDAIWDDDSVGLRLELSRYVYDDQKRPNAYFLSIFSQVPSRRLIESFNYDTDHDSMTYKDSSGHKTNSINDKNLEQILLDHLRSGGDQDEEMQAAFAEIAAMNERRSDGLLEKARKRGRAVLKRLLRKD